MKQLNPDHERNLRAFDDSQQMRERLCAQFGHQWQPTVLATRRMCRRCKRLSDEEAKAIPEGFTLCADGETLAPIRKHSDGCDCEACETKRWEQVER